MNRQTVTVTSPPSRIADFMAVFGAATVPVKQLLPVPFMAALPGIGRQRVYELDIDSISPEQRERLIGYGMERFAMSREECEAELSERGFPILADGCVFSSDSLAFL